MTTGHDGNGTSDAMRSGENHAMRRGNNNAMRRALQQMSGMEEGSQYRDEGREGNKRTPTVSAVCLAFVVIFVSSIKEYIYLLHFSNDNFTRLENMRYLF